MVGCDDLKRNAYFYLDGEMEEEQGKAFQSHLDGCPPCKCRIVIHQRLRILVRHRLTVIVAPDQLRQRIRAAMRSNGQPI